LRQKYKIKDEVIFRSQFINIKVIQGTYSC
jgi:hypothetical protein